MCNSLLNQFGNLTGSHVNTLDKILGTCSFYVWVMGLPVFEILTLDVVFSCLCSRGVVWTTVGFLHLICLI